MLKLNVLCWSVCVMLVVTSALVFAYPPCTGLSTECFYWGPDDDPNPYPGYCCIGASSPALRSWSEGEKANYGGSGLQCGTLTSITEIYGELFCDTPVAGGCGGEMVHFLCEPVQH